MPSAMPVEQFRALLAPVLGGSDVATVSAVDGGLVNRIYRVERSGGRDSLAIRIYLSGVGAWVREQRLLERVGSSIPAPEVVFASDRSTDFPHPFVVYRWIDGITLNECRRREPRSVLESLAESVGRLAGAVATVGAGPEPPQRFIAEEIAVAEERLRDGLARTRLGCLLADQLRARFDDLAARLVRADESLALAHGDFGGRNILVAPGTDGEWRVAALLDWEQAFVGATLWDVGSLFRYAHRYSPLFCDRFAIGYRDAGGTLAHDWHHVARMLDATRLVAILNDERELSTVFDECRELIAALEIEANPSRLPRREQGIALPTEVSYLGEQGI